MLEEQEGQERRTRPGRGRWTEAPGSASASGTSSRPPGDRAGSSQAGEYTVSVCSGLWEKAHRAPTSCSELLARLWVG